MTTIQNFVTSNWGMIVVAIIVIAVVVRQTIYKSNGATLTDEDIPTIFEKIKVDYLSLTAKLALISEIDKTKGRTAAKGEIITTLKEYISTTTLLTKTEKSFLLLINLTTVIDELETELVKMGILTEWKTVITGLSAVVKAASIFGDASPEADAAKSAIIVDTTIVTGLPTTEVTDSLISDSVLKECADEDVIIANEIKPVTGTVTASVETVGVGTDVSNDTIKPTENTVVDDTAKNVVIDDTVKTTENVVTGDNLGVTDKLGDKPDVKSEFTDVTEKENCEKPCDDCTCRRTFDSKENSSL